MITERELDTPTGALRTYDTGDAGGPAVLWCHGSPNIGRPPEPLFAAGAALGVRWLGYDRPGYGGSAPQPGRTVADEAGRAALVADAAGVERFAVLAHSGGGPGALAMAALLPARVAATAAVASLAPWGADGLDWFAGFADGGRRELGAAREGREAVLAELAKDEWDETTFTAADHAALAGEWSWFLPIVQAANASGPGPVADDDLAAVAPWGVDPAGIASPVLLVAGTADRMVPASHSRWLAARIPGAELWERPGDGHISVLAAGRDVLGWLAARG